MASGDNKRNLAELLRAGGYDEEGNVPYSSNLAETSKEVQRRVRALKKFQLESITLESEFYKRVHELEKEFQPMFDAINVKRKAVVTGEHEPTDAECDVPLVHGLGEEELQKLEKEAPIEGTPSKGIPEFWYNALNNTSQLGEMMHEYDVPILKYLFDITTEVHSEPTGFTLLFHFNDNPYFTNTVLKKYYELKITPDNDDPYNYDGPTVVKCRGTEINWKEGKNVTQKVVKKKQKKGSGAGKFITKTVSNESFFNFFDAELKELTEEMDETLQESLREDFEVGQIIRDQIIPRADEDSEGDEDEE
ncbi:nucleosome assembly protein (NAP) domain-containing protein [Ditylenchus destructor]|nr:nucleosome assembly protein (NAP) domain-containing protein [Ditylenchus destructor]